MTARAPCLPERAGSAGPTSRAASTNAYYHVLPYIEEVGVFELGKSPTNGAYYPNSSSDGSGANITKPHFQPIKLLQCPSDPTMTPTGIDPYDTNSWYLSSYGFNLLVFGKPSLDPASATPAWNYGNAQDERHWSNYAKMPESFPDGTSKTILLTDKLAAATGRNLGSNQDYRNIWARWDKDGYSPVVSWQRIVGFPGYNFSANNNTTGPVNALTDMLPLFNPSVPCDHTKASSGHTAAIMVGMADGSVKAVSKTVSAASWYAAMTPNAKDVMGSDF